MDIDITQLSLLGPYDHIYNDDVFNDATASNGTHYVAIAYKLVVDDIYCSRLPDDQHNEYKLFTIEELQNSERVHYNTKAYFR